MSGSHRDAEEADIQKEVREQAKGPAARAHELDELTQIYEDRGVSRSLARQVSLFNHSSGVQKSHGGDLLSSSGAVHVLNPQRALLPHKINRAHESAKSDCREGLCLHLWALVQPSPSICEACHKHAVQCMLCCSHWTTTGADELVLGSSPRSLPAFDLSCAQVAEELTAKDVIRAHARDELGMPAPLTAVLWPTSNVSANRMNRDILGILRLACLHTPGPGMAHTHTTVLAAGIDLDDLTNPYQAASASALAFCLGGGLPLLAAAFIHDSHMRILSVVCSPLHLNSQSYVPA